MNIPWSKKHKDVFGKCQYSLSNSFAQPLSHATLVELTLERGDNALVELYNNHSLEYTPNGGSHDLRTEIAKLYDSTNITADHILVTTGAQVALQTAALAFGLDSHSIVFVPGYQSTVEFLTTHETNITCIPRTATQQWQVDIQQVRDAIREDTKFILLNEPHNPSGTCMSRETQAQLIPLAREHNITILCDEVYRLLEHDANQTRLPAICTVYEQGISCVTLSKPWGACGVTIGWLACPSLEIKDKLANVQYFGTACPSRASEIQAIMVLRASDTILHQNLQIIQSNKQLLQTFIKEYPDVFTWVPPTAGAICFIQFKGPLSSEEFGNLLQSRGISCKPAYCFMETVIPEMDYFRVGFGEAKFPKALQALKVVVEEHVDEWRSAMHRSERI